MKKREETGNESKIGRLNNVADYLGLGLNMVKNTV